MNWIILGVLLSSFSSIAVAILVIFLVRHLKNEIRILFPFFVILGGIEAFTTYNWLSETKAQTVWIVHVITLVQYVVFAWLFSFWQNNDEVKKWLRWSIPAFILFWALAKLFFEAFTQYDTYTSTIAALILSGVSSYTLYLLSLDNDINMYQDTRFWIAAGTLLYFTGNLFFWALTNIILNLVPAKEAQPLWAISWFVNVFANGLYAKGLLCQRPR